MKIIINLLYIIISKVEHCVQENHNYKKKKKEENNYSF